MRVTGSESFDVSQKRYIAETTGAVGIVSKSERNERDIFVHVRVITIMVLKRSDGSTLGQRL